MVEQRSTVRPNEKSKEELLAQARRLKARRNNAPVRSKSSFSTQKPVVKKQVNNTTIDKKELEKQRKLRTQQEYDLQKQEILREAERARLEEQKRRQKRQEELKAKKLQEQRERELYQKAHKVVKSKQSQYVKPKKKSKLAKKGISKLKLKKGLSALITLVVLGVSGITIYKSGLIQNAYSDYMTRKAIEEAQTNSNNTPIVLPDNSVVIVDEEEEVEEEEVVEEKHEYINTDMYDEGYEFNEKITPEFLRSLNPILSDNTAWLEIPGTNISYAFVHPSTDNIDQVAGLRTTIGNSGQSAREYMNGYFLHNDITLRQSGKGALFLDLYNNILSNHYEDLSDVNTIYGHHMADGSMFQKLMKWKTDTNGTYNAEHPFALIYTDDGYAYKVTFIASRVIDGKHSTALHNYDFDSYEEKCEYIQGIIDEAHQNGWFALDDYEVQPDDKFMNFVTCTYEYTNARFQLIGVMQKIKVRDTSLTDNQDGYYVEQNSSALNR